MDPAREMLELLVSRGRDLAGDPALGEYEALKHIADFAQADSRSRYRQAVVAETIAAVLLCLEGMDAPINVGQQGDDWLLEYNGVTTLLGRAPAKWVAMAATELRNAPRDVN